MYVEIMKKHNYANGFYENMMYVYHMSFLFFVCMQFYPYIHWENGLQVEKLSFDIVQNILQFNKIYYRIELAGLALMPYIHHNSTNMIISNVLLQILYYGMGEYDWTHLKVFVCVVSYLDTVYSLMNFGIKYNPSKMMYQLKTFVESVLIITAIHHMYEVVQQEMYMKFDTLHIILYGFLITNVVQKSIDIVNQI